MKTQQVDMKIDIVVKQAYPVKKQSKIKGI